LIVIKFVSNSFKNLDAALRNKAVKRGSATTARIRMSKIILSMNSTYLQKQILVF